MDEKDAKAKSRSRRSHSNSAPGARHELDNSQGGEEETRPGAKSLAAAEAARLDERIAAKQGSRPSKGSKEGRRKSHSKTGSRASRSQLNQLEEDIVTKSRARSDVPATVGAVPASRTELTQLEDDIAAKRRSGSSRSSTNTRTQLNNLEDDLAAKTRSRNETSRVAGSRNELSQFEEDVIAKNKARDSGNAPNANTRNDLDILEADAIAKNRAKHGHVVDLEQSSYLQNPAIDSHQNVHLYLQSPEMDDLDKAKESLGGGRQQFGRAYSDKEGLDAPPESAPPVVSSARGVVNEPEVEFGTYDTQNGHGFADNGLAVAVAISPDEGDAFIPAAVEYEPDAKPPIYKNRRFRLYAAAAVVLFIVIVMATAVGVTQSKSSETAPTFAPTSYRDSLGIQEHLVTVVGAEKLYDETSPQAKAAEWLINEDPMALDPDADNLIQRYLLALFYFDTTQVKGWLSCNKPTGDETDECGFQKLIRAFPELEYEEVPWFRWLSGVHECKWAGVFCDEFNQTRALELTGQKILGTFPKDMALMPYLQSLTMTWNEFGGTMPSELASMKHLLNIEFHSNFFSGQVPPEWYTAQALQRINIADNMLTGQIPTELGNLSTMKGFFNFENSLTGTVPTEMGNMKFLSFTRWGRNFIQGNIPSELGKLEKLQEMWMHRNQFRGSIPTELGLMRDMADLRLHFNKLDGPLHEELYNMTQLKRLDVYDCNISGTISPRIGELRVLQTYRVRNNAMSGTIPTEMGLNTKLEFVWLHGNNFSGAVPNDVCELRGPRGLQALDVDCGNYDGVGPPLVTCPSQCCTGCCDGATGVCLRASEG